MVRCAHNCALFPIQQPNPMPSGSLPLSLGLSHYNRVTSHRVGSHHIVSGQVTSRRVRSHRVGSGHIASGRVTSRRVGSHRVGSGHIASGRVTSCWVTSHRIGSGHIALGRVGHAIIGSSWCAFPPCFIPLLCMLFPTTPCEGLAFTYMLSYLASVIATLGACP